jgi:hypothetical protein
VPSVSISYKSLSLFHGGNTGSNPVGDAKHSKVVEEFGVLGRASRNVQLGTFLSDSREQHSYDFRLCVAFLVGNGLNVGVHRDP